MRNKNIVIVGLQSWDMDIGSNCKNIALELCKQNRVLYVNRSLDRITYFRNRKDNKVQSRVKSIKGEKPDLENIASDFWVLTPGVILESVNWMPNFLFRRFNYINNKRIARAIKNACKRLGFENIVLFIDNDFYRAQYLPELLNANLSIYYIRDYLINHSYFKKHGSLHESLLIKKADLVVTNSSYLSEYAKKFNSNSWDIGQGCDFTYFKPGLSYTLPQDMGAIPKPVIGYVGALVHFRLNIELLVTLAKKRPGWNWVFVGPEDEAFKKSELHQLPNVYFLGSKPPSQLANYISGFDVCINPQAINEITAGNYPRKVDEYLALGKPVVASYTSFMKAFENFVYLCKNEEEYLMSIEKALLEKDEKIKKERTKFAFSHTWENSVNRLYYYCEKTMKNHGTRK